MLTKCSFFDKRFTGLKFLSKDERDKTIQDIREECRSQASVSAPVNRRPEMEDHEPRKKKICLQMDSESEDEEQSEDEMENEVDRFIAAKGLKMSEDPLLWWRQHHRDFPIMGTLARKYLSVTASATPAERVMSKMGLTLTKKRLAMKSDLFSKMMFLSDLV